MFGWKEIGALLRLKRNRLFSYKLSARVLFLIGLGAGVLQIVHLLWSFLLPLVLPLKLLFLSLLFLLLFLVFTIMNTLYLLFSFFSSRLIWFLLLIKKKKLLSYTYTLYTVRTRLRRQVYKVLKCRRRSSTHTRGTWH